MPSTSTFFSNTTGYDGEINLIDDLVREQIKLYGVDILYMPRWNVNLDRLLHESTKSVFELAMSIPMYIKSFDGYDNSMEMLTKFGVRSSDEITLVMSRSEWSAYYAPFVQGFYNDKGDRVPESELNPLTGETARRPKEGDFRSNLALGGKAETTKLTPKEIEICNQIKPALQAEGLFFVGIDVIGGMLSEINVTSPTGIREVENLMNVPLADQVIIIL